MRKKRQKVGESDLEQLTRLFEENLDTIRRAVTCNATESVRQLGLPLDEMPDLEQDCYLAIWIRLPQFDESRAGLATFADRVARSTLRSIAREARAAKRTPMGTPPGTHRGSDHGHRLDVRRLVSSLSGPDRDICRLLAQYSRADASRRSGLSRTSFYRAISRIRKAFVAAKLV